MLRDSFGRTIDYLRISVTDRCNLRCFYCMPADGIDFVPREELLSYEEIEKLLRILVPAGVRKVRFTGGEPFSRRGFVDFLGRVAAIPELNDIRITTNGSLCESHLATLKELGITQLNLSLDTMDAERFRKITRRDSFDVVHSCLKRMLELDFDVKINMVVMPGVNSKDIIPMAQLAIDNNLEVRYIEEMPFNGKGDLRMGEWDHMRILKELQQHFPLHAIDSSAGATATTYTSPNMKGRLGIIAAYSRTFCGTCNRLRVSSTGQVRTCLYGKEELDLRSLIRTGASDDEIIHALAGRIALKPKDGYEAEQSRKPVSESMTTVGG